jgi:hypothetical protein
MQNRPVVEVEHVSADDGGRLATVSKSQEPDDAFRLNHDVVVHQQNIVAAVLDSLEHSPGEPPRAAEVGLVDNPQLPVKGVPDFFITRGVRDFLRTLVHNKDFLHVLQCFLVFCEEPQIVEAEVSLV